MVDLLRKLVVIVAGSLLLLLGLIMLITPGPGILMLLAGLGVMGTEFPALRRWTGKKWTEVRERTPFKSGGRNPQT